jgi:DNA polymerase-3 subunit gamma/tau
MLTKEAFNALLKTLEEPPRYVTFIFATTEPQKLPATIISRCQRYDFRRIPGNRIAKHISQLAEKEGLILEDDASTLIAHRADGGLRDSLSLLDQILAYSPKGNLSATEVSQILGILPLDAFDKIAEKILDREPAGAIMELDSLLESGIDIAQVCDGLSEHFHGALKFAVGVESEDIGEKEKEIYARIAEQITAEDILRISKLLIELQSRLKFASQPRYLFEETLIYLTNMENTVSIRRAIKKAGSEDNIPPKKRENILRTRIEDEEEISATIDDSPKGRLIREFAAKRGDTKADWVRDAEFIIDEARLILKFPHRLEFQVNSILLVRENLEALKESVQAVYGEHMDIKLTVEEGVHESTPKKQNAELPDNVKSLLDEFDAKLDL